MSGVALSWLATLLVGLAALLLLVIAAVLLARTVRTLTLSYYCPWARRDVTAEFLTGDRGEPIGVLSCTAFADQSSPTCGRMCVGGEGREGLGERTVADVLRG